MMTNTNTVVTVLESTLNAALKTLKRLVNRAAKAGVATSFSVGQPYDKDCIDNIGGMPCKQKFRVVDVTLENKMIYGDWEYIGYVEYDKVSNSLKKQSISELSPVPAEVEAGEMRCENCNRTIKKRLFAVKKVGTDDVKLVGPSCLADYTGGLTSSAVLKSHSALKALNKIAHRPSGLRNSYDYSFCYYPVRDVMGMACRILDKEAHNDSIQNNDRALTEEIIKAIRSESSVIQEGREDKYQAQVSEVIDYFETTTRTIDLVSKVRTAIVDDYCKEDRFPFLASAVQICGRFKEEDAKKEAEKQAAQTPKPNFQKRRDPIVVGKFYGQIGQTETDQEVEITCRKQCDSGNYWLTFKLDTGEVLSAFYPTPISDGKHRVNFTIARHGKRYHQPSNRIYLNTYANIELRD